MRRLIFVALAACGSNGGGTSDDAAVGDDDATVPMPDAATTGMVTGVTDVACPMGAPPNATCKTVTVTGCPGIESEALAATLAISNPPGTARGTIVHLSGGGGISFQLGGAQAYAMAGFRQVFVAWASDWEQTASAGIKTAGCRPATLLRWMFDDPAIHGGNRTLGFCGEGFSGGSGQLGYALAHYGLGDYLDYVNELSGPPFARIDLGCDGDAPATAMVCGATVTMRLPMRLDNWENNPPAASCGAQGIPAADLARWKSDSIAIGGSYAYPKTRVEFFDCTNQATAVTAMAQLYHDAITSDKAFHCYSQADNCQGEGLGTGATDAIRAMVDGCVPRH